MADVESFCVHSYVYADKWGINSYENKASASFTATCIGPMVRAEATPPQQYLHVEAMGDHNNWDWSLGAARVFLLQVAVETVLGRRLKEDSSFH